jgi:hypothetical protein
MAAIAQQIAQQTREQQLRPDHQSIVFSASAGLHTAL